MERAITISVIICTRNRYDDLVTFLTSLARQTLLPDQLIIVDSSTKPIEQHDALKDILSQGVYTYLVPHIIHTQPGLTLQRNAGISQATGDLIFFFDDDVILEPDYINVMRDTFKNNPACAGGMGSVMNIKPRTYNLYRLFRIFFLLDRNHAQGKFTYSGMPTHTYGNSCYTTTEVLGGCCMAFRHWVLQQETFDEALRYYAYMEDCDISYRISRKYALFYEPRARLIHNESPVNRDRLEQNRAMFIANYSYLFFKNIYPAARWKIVFYAWTVLGLLVEGVLRLDRRVFFGYLSGLYHVLRTRARSPYCPYTSVKNIPCMKKDN